jgi:uncharacterized membrane protein HdeD (DUF308 family)
MKLAYATLDLEALSARWWIFVVRGIAAILFGVAAMVWPAITVLALTLLWGAYALADGVLGLTLAARAGRAGKRWGWLFFSGLVSIGAAVIAVVWPAITALALLMLIAVWAVFTGAAQIVAAIELRRVIRGEWLLALSGVLSIVFGVLMMIFPGAGALAVVGVIAAYAIVFGVFMMGLGIRMHRGSKSRDRLAPAGGIASHA